MSEELRGILNSGHTRRAAFVIRCDGESLEPRMFRTFAPKAVAAIGSLPSTLEDRSLKIALTRKPVTVIKADAYDEDEIRLTCNPTRSKIARAADDYLAQIEDADPERPAGLNDRQWNNWKPLFAIASVAGGDWFKRAVEAAVTLSSGESEPDENLLALRHVYEVLKTEPEGRLSTEAILGALVSRDDGPWAEKWARDLHADQTRRDIRGPSAALAKLLKLFGIKPKQVWIDGHNQRGYDLGWFEVEAVAPFLADTPEMDANW
jgi:putative DNA primase/helicase